LEIPTIDPRVFDPASIDPETAAFNPKIEKELSAMPPLYQFEPQVIRDAHAAGYSIFGPIKHLEEAHDRMVSGPAGDIPIRVFIPDKATGVYMHMHGGGFMLGSADQQDEFLFEICRTCQVAVVSAGYRLAPENPYPSAPDDCEAVAVWLAENSSAEFGTDKLVIGGESAGANLSLFMHMRWLAAGSKSELAVYPGGIHAFNFFPIELARKANTSINDFIIRAMADE